MLNRNLTLLMAGISEVADNLQEINYNMADENITAYELAEALSAISEELAQIVERVCSIERGN